MNWQFHPGCLLFPPLPEVELQALAEDIRQRGLSQPIVTFQGAILDGRNRLAACQLAGVLPRFEEWNGTGSPLEWCLSANLHRRHLTASQKAVLAIDLLPLLEVEAKQRQSLSLGRGKKVANEKGPPVQRGKASQFAARLTGTNPTYVERVKKVKKIAPELVDCIRIGELSVSEANRLCNLDSMRRKEFFRLHELYPDKKFNAILRQISQGKQSLSVSPVPHKSSIEIWCGDCLQLMRERIADSHFDLICTSPPFNRGLNYGTYHDRLPAEKYHSWLDEVFQEFKRVLKPSGSLFLIAGHSGRDPWSAIQMGAIAGKYLELQNQIIWVKSISIDGVSYGHFTPIPGRRFLNRNWDYIFHFSKEGTVPLDRLAVGAPYVEKYNSIRSASLEEIRCKGDVWFIPFETVHGDADRGDHPAVFPCEITEQCLKLIGYSPKTVLLDPFCGVNGITGAANLNVNAIGIDLDPRFCEFTGKKCGVEPRFFTTSKAIDG